MSLQAFIGCCLLQIVRMDSTKFLVNCLIVMVIIHTFFLIWKLYWTTETDSSIFDKKIDKLEVEFDKKVDHLEIEFSKKLNNIDMELRELEFRWRLRGRSILSTKLRKRKLKKRIRSNSKRIKSNLKSKDLK